MTQKIKYYWDKILLHIHDGGSQIYILVVPGEQRNSSQVLETYLYIHS